MMALKTKLPFGKYEITKMKKIAYTMAMLIVTVVASSQTPAQNEVKAEQKVEAAKINLKDAEENLDVVYMLYKKDAIVQIDANDKKIKELRARLVKPRRAHANDARINKIDELQDRNVELRKRLYTYQAERSDWAAFKAKFNNDKDELHKAVDDVDKGRSQ